MALPPTPPRCFLKNSVVLIAQLIWCGVRLKLCKAASQLEWMGNGADVDGQGFQNDKPVA